MSTLLSISADSKTIKGQKFGYLTGILYLAPADTIPGYNTCPMASILCKDLCIYKQGRGRFNPVQQARINKTLFYFNDRPKFIEQLDKEILALKKRAAKMGLKPAVRLNGTSDLLPVEYIQLIEKHSDIAFYDYTKVFKRLKMALPANYSLTFSRSETNEIQAIEALKNGFNVAVVFEALNDELPILWNGYPVINGDESDLRFTDSANIVVGLKAKGTAKKDKSGFVVLKTDTNSIYLNNIKQTA